MVDKKENIPFFYPLQLEQIFPPLVSFDSELNNIYLKASEEF